MDDENAILTTFEPRSGEITFLGRQKLPSLISNLGDSAIQRFVEFFTAVIENVNTQDAYGRDLLKFFNWCETHKLMLQTVQPLHIAIYIDKVLAG